MSSDTSKKRSVRVPLFVALCLLIVGASAIAMNSHRLPFLAQRTDEEVRGDHDPTDGHAHDDHDDHDHDHDHDDDGHDDGHDDHAHDDHGHEDGTIVELSENGLKNVGYEPFVVQATSYDKLLTLPAIVVERPGRSQIHITAPLTGIVAEIHSVTGEGVLPDQPLFEMRLTHEELVAAQRDFLRTAENLDVVIREIARLKSLGEGVVAGRRVLEKEYEQQKFEASLYAEKQALLLHGISEEQVAAIQRTRQLFRAITVRAPPYQHKDEACAADHLFQIQRLEVARGEQVEVGQELAVLSDHCELHLEGLAFEDDAPLIRRASEAGKPITATPLSGDSSSATITDLQVLYVAGQIDAESRAFKVYVRLPNELALDKTSPTGKRFLEWRYKPGQRMQLGVPVETWENQLVLPTTAVVIEGAEAYVYQQDGNHFHQVSVHVLHRDPTSVVVANDGTLFPSDIIAGKGAYQMHLALKNQSGGGIDPHAGHNH